MSRTITFYGASDDLVEVEGNVPGCDEYPAAREGDDQGAPHGEGRTFVVAGVVVSVAYMPGGTWGILVWPVDEGSPRYVEDYEMGTPVGYTTRLTMSLADDSRVVPVRWRDLSPISTEDLEDIGVYQ